LILEHIQTTCKKYLNNYNTSIQEDKKILENQNNKLSENIINCILMRLGEKKIINFYLEFTEYNLALLKLDDSKEIKKKIKKDFKSQPCPYNSYINSVVFSIIK
jgi:hypothetical protein